MQVTSFGRLEVSFVSALKATKRPIQNALIFILPIYTLRFYRYISLSLHTNTMILIIIIVIIIAW